MGRNYHSASSTPRSINGVAGWSNNKEHKSNTASEHRCHYVMFDIDDLLIYHPNIILTSDVYDILDNMHKYLCN